ncbi:hypothetical protein SDC9_74396 [bioreactor metagenome]|uniref:TraX protein n=2 Tax=root TaxID=1 RepID=A0A644YJ10_9ZZZZ
MTTTMLKIVALVTMLIDHIWAFIPGTPYYFHWIGRISAPIFMFCCIIGYTNTKNKIKYISRLYVLSLVMGGINAFLDIQYNFIRTLLIIIAIIFIIEKFEERNRNAKRALITFVLWQIVSSLIIMQLQYLGVSDKILIIMLPVLSNILMLDGGMFFVLMGVLMYIFRNSKKNLLITYILLTVLNMLIYNTKILKVVFHILEKNIKIPFTLLSILFESVFFGVLPAFMKTDLLYGDPQWMMIFALPFILMYNGEKGRELKYLFYVFYPVHIIILYYLGIAFIK